MRLRTTPNRLGLRDVELFPALERTRQRCGYPYTFAIILRHERVHFNVDGFFVELELAKRLTQLYKEYINWWLYDLTLREPRDWVTHSIFNGNAGIVVHRDHAQWWIDLFNEAAVFTFSPWRRDLEAAPATVPATRP
jgi:hypothetical protein